MEKRKGEKFELDVETFKSFDTNGDGKVSPEEFETNLHPKTRKAIEKKLNDGWTFDEALWAASAERHKDDPPFDPALAYGPADPWPYIFFCADQGGGRCRTSNCQSSNR